MTFDQILDLLTKGGLLGMSVGILFGGYKGVWYWGNAVREREAEALGRFVALETDRDEWKTMALAAIRIVPAIAAANGKDKP